MKHLLFISCCLAILPGACTDSSESTVQSFFSMVDKLKTDQNHTYLRTLQPAQADIFTIFRNDGPATIILNYSNDKWSSLDNVPDDSMKPLTDDAITVMLSATKSELESGHANGLPPEYIEMAQYLQDDVTVYGIRYLNADSTEQKVRSAFFRLQDKWVLLPRPYFAFEEQN